MKRGLEQPIYDVPAPPISLPNSAYLRPSAADVSGSIPNSTFALPGFHTGANAPRQTAVTSRLVHDNSNSPICQRQCIFSLPSKEIGTEKLYNARSFNAEYEHKRLTARELKKTVNELLMQGTSISNTLMTDMTMTKSRSRMPWNTGGPMVDLFVSGRVTLIDSWPNAKASDRLYWILKPTLRAKKDFVDDNPLVSETDEQPQEKVLAGHRQGTGPDLYQLQLVPVTRRLNDPSISDLVFVPGQPWIQGKFFCVGTITDSKSVPVPDLSLNTYDPGATMQQELMVRDRMVTMSRRVGLC